MMMKTRLESQTICQKGQRQLYMPHVRESLRSRNVGLIDGWTYFSADTLNVDTTGPRAGPQVAAKIQPENAYGSTSCRYCSETCDYQHHLNTHPV